MKNYYCNIHDSNNKIYETVSIEFVYLVATYDCSIFLNKIFSIGTYQPDCVYRKYYLYISFTYLNKFKKGFYMTGLTSTHTYLYEVSK